MVKSEKERKRSLELFYSVSDLGQVVHLSTDEFRMYLESQRGTTYLRLIGLSVAAYKGRRISARAGSLVSTHLLYS